ncbi:hypothetical protein DEI86_13650 [Curtobacterium sp. MCBD17_028]|nr:hypothetical protein DEI86_13650 [Curtobacterium sp. MCBD17_028]
MDLLAEKRTTEGRELHLVEGGPVVPIGKHGTTNGYQRGCRDPQACPKGDDGRSCVQAYRDYQREYRLRRKAQEQERREADAPVQPADAQPVMPAVEVVEAPPVAEDEEPRPRGKQVLDDAVRTLAEALELQRAIAQIGERALRTIRIEINHLRREVAAHESKQERS